MKYIYIVQDKEKMLIYGAFSTEEKANKFTNKSDSLAIIKLEVT